MNAENAMNEMLTLIEKHKDEFHRFVYRNVWNPSAAEDVFSSAVLVALSGHARFTPGSNFRAWMYKILANKCFVANRERARAGTDLDSAASELLSLYDRPEYTDVLGDPEKFIESCGDEVVRAFKRLTTAERSCILLRSVEAFSYKEIAESLGMPVGTVMTHLARGRAKLRTDLLEYAESEGIVRHPATAGAYRHGTHEAVMEGGAA